MKDLNQKSYNSVLTETFDFFKSQGISIIGEGFKEIATNPALLESYVESLVEGASPDSAAIMSQLMANANTQILQEGALAGIAPIASLSMPVIRKLWPKFALKDALKTEVAKTPRFVISYMRPYMWKANSERVYLPFGQKQKEAWTASSGRDYITAVATVAAGTVVVGDFNANSSNWVLDTEGKLVVSGASKTTRQPLDSDFRLASVYVDTTLTINTTGPVTAVYRRTVQINERLSVNNTIIYDVVVPQIPVLAPTSTFIDASGALQTVVTATTAAPAQTGQIIVRADLQNGKATVAVVGLTSTANVTLKVGVSEEFNEQGWSVSFDIARKDVDIPSGQHLNAPLPIEALTDMMALYQIDGTKETVDLMTNVFAMRLDLEVLEFLEKSFINQPGVKEFQTAQYPSYSAYSLTFDVRPAAGFAGSPKAWREELKPQIDHLSQRIKNNTYLQSGMFTLVGNPLDIQLLTNVDWQFRGGQGVSMDGVDVDYSVGTYVGANAYRVLASVNVPAGQIYLIFTPSSDTQMTYKYYPYTFNTEMGYIDPNRSRVPSIMMTKRHTFQEFLPAIGLIVIANNDGSSQFSPGYAPWSNTTGEAGK
jgi:hypothetical protein